MQNTIEDIVFQPHNVGKIVSGKTHLQDILLAETELFLNVGNRFFCRRSRQSKDRTVGKELPDLGYLQIRRTEIVTPLTNAMCFINSNETHFHATQLVEEYLALKPFGRDIQEFVGSENAVIQDGQHHFVLHKTANISGLYSTTTQSLNLILHQGNERCQNYADTLHGKGWHLKRYALASASRHQAKSVVSCTDAFNDLSLNAAKIIIAPVLLKNRKVRHPSFILSA